MGCGGDGEIKETSEQVALAEISKEQLSRYKDVLAPFEAKWLKDSQVTKLTGEKTADRIGAGVEAKMAGARRTARSQADLRKLSTTQGVARSSGQVEGGLSTEGRNKATIETAVNIGRGEATEAVAGMGDSASDSVSRAINKGLTDQTKRDATADMVGSAAGVAAYGASKIPGEPPAGTVDIDNLDFDYSLAGDAKPRKLSRYSVAGF